MLMNIHATGNLSDFAEVSGMQLRVAAARARPPPAHSLLIGPIVINLHASHPVLKLSVPAREAAVLWGRSRPLAYTDTDTDTDTDRQTDRQTDRHTHTRTHTHSP